MAHKRIAFCCDAAGRITEILRDDRGLLAPDAIGAPLAARMSGASTSRVFEMLAELRRDSAIFGWSLELATPEDPLLLHFAGAQDGDRALLIASEDLQDVRLFNDEVLQIGNEHTSRLHARIQERTRSRPGPDGHLFDEVTALSNEVTVLQRQLARRSAELERMLEEKNRLMGMWAHDMRSPLMVAAGFAGHLARDPGISSSQREIATEIDQACSNITRLVDELVDWSALDAVAVRIDVEPVDIAALVERLARLHDLVGQGSDVKVAMRRDGAVPPVLADPRRMRQVLDNLVSNALRAAPRGSTVEVGIRRDAGSVVVSVSDAGPGVDPAQLATLFDPYTRGEGEGRTSAGWGLGLAIVKRLVDLQQGSIEVESRPGSGTTFHVRLPVAGGDAP